jgi:hypothetical protein
MGGSISQPAPQDGPMLTPSQRKVLAKLNAYNARSNNGSSLATSTASSTSAARFSNNGDMAKYLCDPEQLFRELLPSQSVHEDECLVDDATFKSNGNDDDDDDDDASNDANKLRVRLVISTASNLPGYFVRTLARVTSTEYGIVHTGLVIGNVLVDWVNSSICDPRPVKSRGAMMLVNLGSLDITDSETADRLKTVCLPTRLYSNCGGGCCCCYCDYLLPLSINHVLASTA